MRVRFLINNSKKQSMKKIILLLFIPLSFHSFAQSGEEKTGEEKTGEKKGFKKENLFNFLFEFIINFNKIRLFISLAE